MLIFNLSFIFSAVIIEDNQAQTMLVQQSIKPKIRQLMESILTLNIPENPIFLPHQNNRENQNFYENLIDVLERGHYSEFLIFVNSIKNYTHRFVDASEICKNLNGLYQLTLEIFNESPCYKEILSEMLCGISATITKFEMSIYNIFGSFENYSENCRCLFNFLFNSNENSFNSERFSVSFCFYKSKYALTSIRDDINSFINRYKDFYDHSWKNKSFSLKAFFIFNPPINGSYISCLIGINHMDRVLNYFYCALSEIKNKKLSYYTSLWLKDFGESVMFNLKTLKESHEGLYPQTNFTLIMENCKMTLNIINKKLKISNQKNDKSNDIYTAETLKMFLRSPEEFYNLFLSLNEKHKYFIKTIENKLRNICKSKTKVIDKYKVEINSLRGGSANPLQLNVNRPQIYARIEINLKLLDEDAKTYYFQKQLLLSCLNAQKEHFSKVIFIIQSLNLSSPNIPEALKERYISLQSLVNVKLNEVKKRISEYRFNPDTDYYFSIFHDPIVEYHAELYKMRTEMRDQ